MPVEMLGDWMGCVRVMSRGGLHCMSCPWDSIAVAFFGLFICLPSCLVDLHDACGIIPLLFVLNAVFL